MTAPRRPVAALLAALGLVLAACTGHVTGHGQVGSAHRAVVGPSSGPAPARTGIDVTVPIPPLEEYVDSSGSPRLAISLDSASGHATWSLALSPGQELVGVMTMSAASASTITVNTRFAVRAIPGASTATLTVTGWLRPTTHQARLALHLDQPPTDAVLDTGTPDVAAARSQVDAIVAAVNTGDWTTLAGLLAPDITSSATPAQLANAFSGAGITHADLKPVGPGRLTRLPSGDPAWLQNYTLTARTASGQSLSQRGVLVLVEENRSWWLLDAGS